MKEIVRIVFFSLIGCGLTFQALAFLNRTSSYKNGNYVFFFRPREHFNAKGWIFRTIALHTCSLGAILVFISEFILQ